MPYNNQLPILPVLPPVPPYNFLPSLSVIPPVPPLPTTQYLDDHTHLPTLRKLPRSTPIVANPGAADVIRPLGFTDVTVIDHGQTVEAAGGRLRITATAGALVGPPWSKRQNGVVFREVTTRTDGASASLYYEPHCDFDEGSVRTVGRCEPGAGRCYVPHMGLQVCEGGICLQV